MAKEEMKEEVPEKSGEDMEEGMKDSATSEFLFRRSELMADLKVGAYGRIVIPVKVIDVGNGMIRVQKDGEAKVDGEFSDTEPLDSMKRRIGVAEGR